MKVIKAIFSWLSLILILMGAGLIAVKYFTNRSLFVALLAEPMVKQSLGIIEVMLYGLAAVVLGLIFLAIAMRIGGSIRSKEKAEAKLRKAVEEEREKARQAEAEILDRQAQENKAAEAEADMILHL